MSERRRTALAVTYAATLSLKGLLGGFLNPKPPPALSIQCRRAFNNQTRNLNNHVRKSHLLATKVNEGATVVSELPDNAFVLRGGTNEPQTLQIALEKRGISANSAPGMTAEELSQGLPHPKIGVATLGEIRGIGGNVVGAPTANNPFHVIIVPGPGESLELRGIFDIWFNPLGATMIRIFADFNARDGDRLPLDFEGSFADIRKQNVELKEGLRIIVYDDQVEAEAIVGRVHGEWYAQIIAGTLRINRWE